VRSAAQGRAGSSNTKWSAAWRQPRDSRWPVLATRGYTARSRHNACHHPAPSPQLMEFAQPRGTTAPAWPSRRRVSFFVFVLYTELQLPDYSASVLGHKNEFNHASETRKGSPLAVWDSAAFGYYPLKTTRGRSEATKGRGVEAPNLREFLSFHTVWMKRKWGRRAGAGGTRKNEDPSGTGPMVMTFDVVGCGRHWLGASLTLSNWGREVASSNHTGRIFH
jgi:hypothetical protein